MRPNTAQKSLKKTPLLSICLVCLMLARGAICAKPPKLITFGDSLMDVGRYFKLSSKTIPPDGFYYRGRFTNGPSWPELLTSILDVPLKSYAVGGSAACTAYKRLAEFPLAQSTQEIVTETLARTTFDWDRHAVILATGNNDFFTALATGEDPTTFVTNVATCIIGSATELLTAGCLKLAIMKLPPLQVTPVVKALPEATQHGVAALVAAINTVLEQQVAALRSTFVGSNIQLLSVSDVLQAVVDDPTLAGLENSSTPCYTCDAPTPTPAYLCPETATQHINSCGKAEVSKHVFLDDLHPSAIVHQLLADHIKTILTSPGGIYEA